MSLRKSRGLVYHCEMCGAEVSVIAYRMGVFAPKCCNKEMVCLERRLAFYRCEICGVEVSVVKKGTGVFAPRCCNEEMELEAA